MNKPTEKKRAPLNRTLTLSDEELLRFKGKLVKPVNLKKDIIPRDSIVHGDLFEAIDRLPGNFIDLLFVDPPYNLQKKFNSSEFKEMSPERYEEWLDSWLSKIVKLLKPEASVYICGDWKSSSSIFNIARKYFKIQNRITWEREKGRGAKSNWKNCSEDIWFCTVSNKFTFNIDDVKMKRRVLAPYRHENGEPKDWHSDGDKNFRITAPSNMWTDITVPFWSMPENTDHPTQKPEKLLAKIILASSNKGDLVFDPFVGSGTTAVVAKKLGRKYLGIDIDELYCCLTEKRLELAGSDKSIQGYDGEVFWERNTLNLRGKNFK